MSSVIRNLEEARRIVECFLNAPIPAVKFVLLEKGECSIWFATPVIPYEFKNLELMWRFWRWLSRRMGAYTELYYELPRMQVKMGKQEVLKWARKILDNKSYRTLKEWIRDKDGEFWVNWHKAASFIASTEKYMGLSDSIKIVMDKDC